MSRPEPSTVIAGLPTKSEMIRALARAGYSRTEIAKYLEIRYQHVRNVLVQAGITAGKRNDLTRARDKRVEKTAESWPASRLLTSGFQKVSECHLTGDGTFQYSARSPAKPGVYAFSVNGLVAYIGLTRGDLRTRLGHYVYGHEKQRTSARVKGLILSALANGDNVEVYVACPPDLEWNGLPVDGASGLETGLIRLIKPPWNRQGAG